LSSLLPPQLIVLSASANKLAKLKEQAEEYAALIMEELDPENLGYIEVGIHCIRTCKYVHPPVVAVRRHVSVDLLLTCHVRSCGSWRRCSCSATRT